MMKTRGLHSLLAGLKIETNSTESQQAFTEEA
jgi:hypothetical protein